MGKRTLYRCSHGEINADAGGCRECLRAENKRLRALLLGLRWEDGGTTAPVCRGCWCSEEDDGCDEKCRLRAVFGTAHHEDDMPALSRALDGGDRGD